MSTKLQGVKIWDSSGQYYYTEVDLSESFNYKSKTQSVVTQNSKYPYIIHQGKALYWTGTVSGNFSDNKSGECDNDYNFYNLSYKLTFVEFLKNGLTKNIQFNWDEENPSQNFIMPVGIVDDVGVEVETNINQGHSVKVTFNWEQVDDRIVDETNN